MKKLIIPVILTLALTLLAGCSAKDVPVTQNSTLLTPAPTQSSTPRPSSAAAIPAGNQVGNQAPDFQLKDLAGNPVSLSDFRGRPVLLNFWATW